MKKSTMAGIGAAAVLAMAAFAAGCGSSSDSASGSSTDTTTATTPTSTGGTARYALAVRHRLHRPGARLLLRLVEIRVRDLREAPQLPRQGRHPRARSSSPRSRRRMPTVSNDGKTYTFTIRDGFKFSPPSNETGHRGDVQARDRAGPQPEDALAGAVVHERHRRRAGRTRRQGQGHQRHQVEGDTLTIRLTEPAPDFLVADRDAVLLRDPTGTPVNPNGM